MQESLEIISAVNSFYSQSFNQLITITLGFLAFAGVLMPILLAWFQKRLFKIEQKEIESIIAERMNDVEERLNDRINNNILTKASEQNLLLEQLDSKLEKNVAHALAGVLHVQGLMLLNNNNYWFAFSSFTRAAIENIKANNEGKLRTVLRLILHSCLPNMGKQNYVDGEYEDSFNELIKTLSNFNTNSAYSDEIRYLSKGYEKLISTINQP